MMICIILDFHVDVATVYEKVGFVPMVEAIRGVDHLVEYLHWIEVEPHGGADVAHVADDALAFVRIGLTRVSLAQARVAEAILKTLPTLLGKE